jgi:hypothetical protein
MTHNPSLSAFLSSGVLSGATLFRYGAPSEPHRSAGHPSLHASNDPANGVPPCNTLPLLFGGVTINTTQFIIVNL